MTVQQLKDQIDHYIFTDQENDQFLDDKEEDQKQYDKRCKQRAQSEVLCLSGSDSSKTFTIHNAHCCQSLNNAFAIIVDSLLSKSASVNME